jgi:hypothetical protein
VSNDGEQTNLDKLVEEYEAKFHALIAKEWRVGANDRGMGHYSYAVITIDEEMVVKCDDQIIAEHIVQVHNADRRRRQV